MSRRLGALIERGSQPLEPAARERVQRWRSRVRRRAAMWIVATPLLPVAMFILVAALFHTGFEPLKVVSTILGIVTVLFVFPATLLSARDGWVRSRRLSRDLREDRVELWAEAAVAIAMLKTAARIGPGRFTMPPK